MDRIELSKGLIAIGGCKGAGKSRFALKLANHIAKIENVLYISYKEYGEKLRAIIEEMDGHVSEKLQLDSSFSYFGSVVFLQIIKQVKEKNISTVFLDDLDNFSGVETNDYYGDQKHEIIGSMKFLSSQNKRFQMVSKNYK